MNKTFLTLLLLMLIVTVHTSSNAQSNTTDSLHNTVSSYPGGERRGLYIAGGTSVLGGAALGFISNGLSEYPRTGLPVIASTIAVAPSSLLGLGLGSLFTKRHSRFNNSFMLGLGMIYSSPVFSEFVPGDAHKPGISIQLLSPQIGSWRYRLSFNRFFPEDYNFEEIHSYRGETKLSWWELNLDLHYLINMTDKFQVYPFVGTQYNSVRAMGASLNTEILANYGLGANLRLIGRIILFGEMQFTVDPDDNPSNMSFSLGVAYKL